MGRDRSQVLARAGAGRATMRGAPLGRILMETGAVAPSDLVEALGESARCGTPLDRVVAAEALSDPSKVLQAQALRFGAPLLIRAQQRPDPALDHLMPAETCLALAALPWHRIGKTLVLATARPDSFEVARAALPAGCGPVMMALASDEDIQAEIAERHGAALARRAETSLPADESCRDLNRFNRAGLLLGMLAGAAALTALALQPLAFFGFAALMATLALLVSQMMKLSALVASWRAPQTGSVAPDPGPDAPEVSILVPLFREENIAEALVARLGRLTYSKALLDVVLVLEQDDDTTREVLARTRLPVWMRVVEVPHGALKTKPRALNYALNFCRGAIIGIYDAEDAPAPDQIEKVVGHFVRAPPDVACLQGILDFYNPRANWLSRCFTIEYASWFRILLPGFARLGFAIPLGGTTVFFRREALTRVGGWDAHNVTEDADLGIRLARYGYRTELLESVTREEANNTFWPWIKQRSRWLKGYMITWFVHSRAPLRLWRDVGAWKFFGVQALFLSTILQFLLTPVLWSFWLVLFGMPHPLTPWMSPEIAARCVALFLGAEAVSALVGIVALARSPRPGLMPWIPTLGFYFPLGVVAAYKALWELFARPFYWDKTAHGRSQPDAPESDLPAGRA